MTPSNPYHVNADMVLSLVPGLGTEPCDRVSGNSPCESLSKLGGTQTSRSGGAQRVLVDDLGRELGGHHAHMPAL